MMQGMGGQGGGGMGGMSSGGWVMPAMTAASNRFSKLEEQQQARRQRARVAAQMRWSPWSGLGVEALPEEPTGPVATTQQNLAMFMGQNEANKDKMNKQKLQEQQMALKQREADQNDSYLNSAYRQQPSAGYSGTSGWLGVPYALNYRR